MTVELITGDIPEGGPAVSEVHRPWGSFRQYAHNRPVTVSLMSVEEGQRLSLQSHPGRGEYWIVLDEGAVVQVDDRIWRAERGEELWIPPNGRHRLTSECGTVRVLEVAFGDWQQEDIVRYDDDYARPSSGD